MTRSSWVFTRPISTLVSRYSPGAAFKLQLGDKKRQMYCRKQSVEIAYKSLAVRIYAVIASRTFSITCKSGICLFVFGLCGCALRFCDFCGLSVDEGVKQGPSQVRLRKIPQILYKPAWGPMSFPSLLTRNHHHPR